MLEITYSLTFYLLAAVAVVSALGVIFIRDIFRAALCLVALFMMVAGLYLMLHADFLAIVQILVYVGAISILIIVAIMLTRDARQGQPMGNIKWIAGLVALALIAVIVWGVLKTPFEVATTAPQEETVKPLGSLLFGNPGYLLTAEIAATLLLSAILGAIAVIREK